MKQQVRVQDASLLSQGSQESRPSQAQLGQEGGRVLRGGSLVEKYLPSACHMCRSGKSGAFTILLLLEPNLNQETEVKMTQEVLETKTSLL